MPGPRRLREGRGARARNGERTGNGGPAREGSPRAPQADGHRSLAERKLPPGKLIWPVAPADGAPLPWADVGTCRFGPGAVILVTRPGRGRLPGQAVAGREGGVTDAAVSGGRPVPAGRATVPAV